MYNEAQTHKSFFILNFYQHANINNLSTYSTIFNTHNFYANGAIDRERKKLCLQLKFLSTKKHSHYLNFTPIRFSCLTLSDSIRPSFEKKMSGGCASCTKIESRPSVIRKSNTRLMVIGYNYLLAQLQAWWFGFILLYEYLRLKCQFFGIIQIFNMICFAVSNYCRRWDKF